MDSGAPDLCTWAQGGMLEVIGWSLLNNRCFTILKPPGGLRRAFLLCGGSDQMRAYGAVVITASLFLWAAYAVVLRAISKREKPALATEFGSSLIVVLRVYGFLQPFCDGGREYSKSWASGDF